MIIITGASRGIGKKIYTSLKTKGKEVCGIARNFSKVATGGYDCDVGSYDELKLVALDLKKKGFKIKAIVNAAGIASMNLALTTPPHLTEKIIKTNLLGTIFSCQVFAPLLIRNQGGSIINFSTVAVEIGLEGESVYVASKAGVEGFSRSFAREMSNFNINVNCVAPGPIDTDLTKNVDKDLIKKVIEKQIIKKKFKPEDVTDIVEFLLSPQANTITAQTLYIGGV